MTHLFGLKKSTFVLTSACIDLFESVISTSNPLCATPKNNALRHNGNVGQGGTTQWVECRRGRNRSGMTL